MKNITQSTGASKMEKKIEDELGFDLDDIRPDGDEEMKLENKIHRSQDVARTVLYTLKNFKGNGKNHVTVRDLHRFLKIARSQAYELLEDLTSLDAFKKVQRNEGKRINRYLPKIDVFENHQDAAKETLQMED